MTSALPAATQGLTSVPHAAAGPWTDASRAAAIRGLQETARLLYDRGWALGTSGNYSVVLEREPLRLLVTASGKDKRSLAEHDFVTVDETGTPLCGNGARPSAETLLHTLIAPRTGAGAVLHTHSVWNTLLSQAHAARGALRISGYEMLKGLAGVTTHETEVAIGIVDNSQDIPALAQHVSARLHAADPAFRHGFLIRGHGLYTWGRDLAEARRHVEILEFLFEVVGRAGPHPPPLAVT